MKEQLASFDNAGINYSETLQPASTKKRALSVSAAIRLTKSLLQEHTFCIEGEVSELNNKSGYKAVYFTIKDEDASLPCLMWKNRFQSSGVALKVGAKVQVTGKFTIFAPKGRMNFDVSRLVLAGDGDLRARVAQLAEKLKKEGLMDASRKRALPTLPLCIGLVTSPRGAAVHDVLRTFRRRYPLARIVFAGVPVEGATAADVLSQAIKQVAASDAEVILLVRGGGSFEDLMPFNDENLARTIASCPKPIVTGIGHEPDTSIADMVADMRASTPTGAAEAVSPQREDLNELLQSQANRLSSSLIHRLNRSRVFIDGIASRPLFRDPSSLYSAEMQSVDTLQDAIERIGKTITRSNEHALDLAQTSMLRIGQSLIKPFESQAAITTSRLNDLSPLKILERGWSIARDESGSILRSVSQVKPHDQISVQLIDGTVVARVEDEVTSEITELISFKQPDK